MCALCTGCDDAFMKELQAPYFNIILFPVSAGRLMVDECVQTEVSARTDAHVWVFVCDLLV